MKLSIRISDGFIPGSSLGLLLGAMVTGWSLMLTFLLSFFVVGIPEAKEEAIGVAEVNPLAARLPLFFCWFCEDVVPIVFRLEVDDRPVKKDKKEQHEHVCLAANFVLFSQFVLSFPRLEPPKQYLEEQLPRRPENEVDTVFQK